MAKGSYKMKSSGWAALAISPQVEAAVVAAATKGLPVAQALSADFTKTGDYLEGFNVRSAVTELRTGFGSHPVVVGILENTSGHAAAVEWGNSHDHKPHHVLGRTLDLLVNG